MEKYKSFQPDYRNIEKAARNIKPDRLPLYEHLISEEIMEVILDTEFAELKEGNETEKKEYFRNYVKFFKKMGYDTVSFERCIGGIMPGSGSLQTNEPGIITERSDFEIYPWDTIKDLYFEEFTEDFSLLREEMPSGMKAIGGPGNGVFELVQELVGFDQLCYISADDPRLYADLFQKVGEIMLEIWEEFMKKFSDIYAVCRFGDDLGFKTSTLISPSDIRKHIIPEYSRVVHLIHSYDKPFLLHSCGNIFSIMEDLIVKVNIDAKHSNEDEIAPFSTWVDKYGDKIGNFGGVDTDILCRKSEKAIQKITREVISYSRKTGGFALGSGNSIPDFVPVSGYLAMVETARKERNE
ncbi:MAG: uroporphyrinogen decarboxylase family protein [bacterium]